MDKAIREISNHLLNLLAESKFREIETITNGVRLSADDVEQSIKEYGCEPIAAPPNAFDYADIVEVNNKERLQWSVRLPLWTREEGRSDLTIEFTVRNDHDGIKIELDNIHVL